MMFVKLGIQSKDGGLSHQLSYGYGENLLSPQIGPVSTCMESSVTSPSPPGKIFSVLKIIF